MPFYDRENEARRLKKALSSNKAKLIVLYGRRRCGKSTLIREVLSDEGLYFMAPQADEAVQITQLANVISTRIKWVNISNPASVANALLQKARSLPKLKNRKIIPVVFAKSAQQKPDNAIQIFTPEEVMERLKR